MKRAALLVILYCGFLNRITASHYRGGFFSWAPVPNFPNKVTLSWRLSWDSDIYPCTQSQVNTGALLDTDENAISCNPQCSPELFNSDVRCTDFSDSMVWSSGENEKEITLAASAATVRFSGCCWLSSLINRVKTSDRFEPTTYIDLTPRADGRINSSPVTNMIPLFLTQQTCTHVIKIPVMDADGDDIRCKWDSSSSNQPNQPSQSILIIDENKCELQVMATVPGNLAIQLLIEDFISTSSSTPLSSVSLQFLISITPSSTCDPTPTFIAPTPADSMQFTINADELFSQEIRAQAGDATQQIQSITTTSPTGFMKSVLQTVGGSNDKFISVQWTPTVAQIGIYSVCYVASDARQLTPQQCFFLEVICPGTTDIDADGLADLCDPDNDNDGILDSDDNCPVTANCNQQDTDVDGLGNACDPDDDTDPDDDDDGVLDEIDNCKLTKNQAQTDHDADMLGNACDDDDDNDDILDIDDNCPITANSDQQDNDEDGLGNACDPDDDDDGVVDGCDNCEFTNNPDQANNDTDMLGDACDDDDDNDDILDNEDNCPITANSDQQDNDEDGLGNACDPDDDDDGVLDTLDNCPLVDNPNLENNDEDSVGDACDLDDDNDGVVDEIDNCKFTNNPDQANNDTDMLGDACDGNDDNDDILDSDDNCPITATSDQQDNDEDGLGNACDPDDDDDGVVDEIDNCQFTNNPDQANNDTDILGDACDDNDDNDDILDNEDNCPITANNDQQDNDEDGLGNACDPDDAVGTVDGTFIIVEDPPGIPIVFTDDLYDPTSPRYQEMAGIIEEELTQAFNDITGFLEVIVLSFFRGSVGVRYAVKFATSVSPDSNEVLRHFQEMVNDNAILGDTTLTLSYTGLVCPAAYCFNEGQCVTTAINFFCRCSDGFYGNQCENLVPTESSSVETAEGFTYGGVITIIFGIVVLVLLLELLFLLLVGVLRRYQRRRSNLSLPQPQVELMPYNGPNIGYAGVMGDSPLY